MTANKPTTLRDHICRFNDFPQECECFKAGLTSHNTELISKIEGLGEVFMVILGVYYEMKSDVPLVSKRDVISLINQEK